VPEKMNKFNVVFQEQIQLLSNDNRYISFDYSDFFVDAVNILSLSPKYNNFA